MLKFSEEQRKIGSAVKDGFNIIVDAVAGSGKTTTLMNISQEVKDKRILALVYNKCLQKETKEKLKGISNVDVFTFHGSATVLYGKVCKNDAALIEIMSSHTKYQGANYEILLVDEAQDIQKIQAQYIFKIIEDLENPQLIFMGDYRQCIYEYKSADSRYLICAEELFSDKGNHGPWMNCILSRTFRCTGNISRFVNMMMGREGMMNSVKEDGDPVRYISTSPYSKKFHRFVRDEIDDYLERGYNYHDIAILVPSIKAPSLGNHAAPHNSLINFLSNECGYPIIGCKSDTEDISEKIFGENKIVFSTFHQFKGRERKIIFVMSFDNSYFKYYDRSSECLREICPNTIYVAVTRASEHLYLIADKRNPPFYFVDMEYVRNNCIFEEFGRTAVAKDKIEETEYKVCNLTKHISFRDMLKLKTFYTLEKIQGRKRDSVTLNTVIKVNNSSEIVSNIYSVAIPFIKSVQLRKQSGILTTLSNIGCYESRANLKDIYIAKCKAIFMQDNLSYEDYAFLSNLYLCWMSGYVYPLNQIHNYKWFSKKKDKIEQCLENLSFLSKEDIFEEEVKYTSYFENGFKFTIHGAIDCITKDTIYEFKCISEFNEEHILQLAIYSAIDILLHDRNLKYKLFNILTCETWELKFRGNPEEFLNMLIKIKGEKNKTKRSTEELKWDLEEYRS